MANEIEEVKPGTRVRYGSSDGVVLIARQSHGEALIYFPTLRVRRWIDAEMVITETQPTNEKVSEL